MALKGPDANQAVKMLIVGLIFLFVLTQFINFAAIGTEGAEIFKAPSDNLVPQAFMWLIVGIAAWVAWNIAMGFEGRMTRKKLIGMIIAGVALYFIYTKVLTPLLPGVLPDLGAAAVQLQSIVVP